MFLSVKGPPSSVSKATLQQRLQLINNPDHYLDFIQNFTSSTSLGYWTKSIAKSLLNWLKRLD